MHLNKNKSGFAVIELILAAVLLIGIVVIGYAVWKTNKDNTNADKQLTASGTTATEASAPKYLDIKEWGVKLKVASPIKGATLTYRIVKNNKNLPPTAFLSTKSLDASKACREYYSAGLSAEEVFPTFNFISRYSPSDKVSIWSDSQDNPVDVTAQDAAKQYPTDYKQIGNYIFTAGHGNGLPCTADGGQQVSNMYIPATNNISLNLQAD